MLYAMPYVHLSPNHNNRTKYNRLELNWHVPKCKCLNRFKSVKILYFSSLIILVCRQSKYESNSTDPLAITIYTSQQNKKIFCHKMAVEPRLKLRLRGFSLEAGSLLSRAGSYNANECYAILSSYKNWPAHRNREENINKNVKSKPFPSPTTTPKIWSGQN